MAVKDMDISLMFLYCLYTSVYARRVNISLWLLLGPLRIIPSVVSKYCNFEIADCFNIACPVLVVSITSAWKAGTYMLLYLDVLAINKNRALSLKLHIYYYYVCHLRKLISYRQFV